MGKVVIDGERCKGCMLCTAACPKKILLLSDMVNQDGYRIVTCKDEERCISCAGCAVICPSACFEIYRERPVAGEGA
jgi:2-oxoglutarate ferredoxin oxidoreductase subunit delta